jgi:hypothetical protein
VAVNAQALAVPTVPIGIVVEFVNEWGTVPQQVSPRPWRGYPDADSPARRALRTVWPRGLKQSDDAEIALACDLVYPVFAARGPEEMAERLEIGIVECGMTAHAGSGPEGIRVGWRTDRADRLLRAIFVASLLRHLTEAPGEPLGVCASPTCADVLVDRSPTHTKHFCSTRCQTRERVQAYRARTDAGEG